MVGYGGSSAGSYLADPTSPIPSHCAIIILFKKCPSASIVMTSTLRVKKLVFSVAVAACCVQQRFLRTLLQVVDIWHVVGVGHCHITQPWEFPEMADNASRQLGGKRSN